MSRSLAAARLGMTFCLAACAGAPVAHSPPIQPASFGFQVDTFRTQRLGDVSHAFAYSPKGPWAINVLDVRSLKCTKPVAVKGAMSAAGRIKTSDMVRDLATRSVVVGGVNADFFSLSNGVPTNALVMGGRVMTPPSKQPVFAIDSTGRPHITTLRVIGRDSFALDDPALLKLRLSPFHPEEAVGGRPRLILDSAIVADVDTVGQPGFATGRHPRTAVGIAASGRRIILLVVDGRRAGYSDGMTLRELANLMLSLGARDALNLDGGGSTTMVITNPKSGALEIVNRPSDATGERTVGDALAIVNSCR